MPVRQLWGAVGRVGMYRAIGIAALMAATTLTLAGCASHPPTNKTTTPPPAAPSTAASPTSAPSEGPAAQEHRYPNGLVVRLVKLEHANRAYGYGLSPGDDPIKVTVVVLNGGNQPFRLIHTWLWTLLYGPNRAEAAPVADVDGETGRVSSVNPGQVGVSQSVTLFATSVVPAGTAVNELAVRVDLDPSGQTVTPWTFAGAQDLLQ